MPALLYASTVLLYVFAGRRRRGSGRPLLRSGGGRSRSIAGALIWLAYELIILIGPSEFRDAQYYVLGALGLGLVFYVGAVAARARGDADRGRRARRRGARGRRAAAAAGRAAVTGARRSRDGAA